ncbi:Short-chain dehydrogenase/reductase SDR [Macrophomina phaseolina MS6]|uniref:Short-chain dehydrogenase/reductase SDR n=1 Tax=Macrophomina phaseolina (strain MS6) TaxID=1126212 RepID=K2SH21_MACPH|nr:Short-chain dehydrogenase/reductase SDR [Macrophomina phaseolina MS6]
MGILGFLNNTRTFDPDTDIGDLTNKVILVTGGNVGLGKQTILELAKHSPAHIYLAARNPKKAQAAITDIQQRLSPSCTPPPITFLELDLSSLQSVHAAAQAFLAVEARLDVLVLNAGILAVMPPAVTPDGYEIHFGTNHVGHALLTRLLLPALRTTRATVDDVRVVVLTSAGHNWAPVNVGIDFAAVKAPAESLTSRGRYGQSKLANALWARELARRHPEITVVAVHPGMVATNIFQNASERSWLIRNVVVPFGTINVEEGVKNQLWAVAAPSEDVVSGEYYEPVGRLGRNSGWVRNEDLARRLWDWTESELDVWAGENGK